MIIRIFIAEVPIDLQEEFQIKFKAISVPIVKNYPGLISLEIGKGSIWNPLEYVMVSRWESEEHLVNFAGEKWNEAHILEGMGKFISKCSMHHFHEMELS